MYRKLINLSKFVAVYYFYQCRFFVSKKNYDTHELATSNHILLLQQKALDLFGVFDSFEFQVNDKTQPFYGAKALLIKIPIAFCSQRLEISYAGKNH